MGRGGATVDEADFFEALVCAERCEEWRALLGRGGAAAGAAARELAEALGGGGPLAGAYAVEARRGLALGHGGGRRSRGRRKVRGDVEWNGERIGHHRVRTRRGWFDTLR